MRARKDCKSTTETPTDIRREQGRHNSYIPKNERARQRPFDEALRADLEWHSPNWKTHWSQTSSSSSAATMVATRTPGYSMARSTLVERVMAQSRIGFFHRFRVQTLANVVHVMAEEDRTPCRTHIFSVSRTLTIIRTCVWLKGLTAQVSMCRTFAHLKSHPLTTCVIDHALMCPTHFLPFVPHHLRLWLESGDSPATLRAEDYSLAIWSDPLTPFTSSEPKTCIDVNSEHTPINYSSRRTSFKRPHHQCRSLRNTIYGRSGTIDFTTDVAGTRRTL